MSGAPCLRDLPEPYFSQSLSHLTEIQNAPNRHRLFEALDVGLNFLRELSARGLISPEDTVDAGRLWGDSADKRLRALPELGSAAPDFSVLDDQGKPRKAGLRGLGGLKELSSLIVVGEVAEGSNQNNFLVSYTE